MQENIVRFTCENPTCLHRKRIGPRTAKFCPSCWSRLVPLKVAEQIKKHRLEHLAGK